MSWISLPLLIVASVATFPASAQTAAADRSPAAASIPPCPGHALCPAIGPRGITQQGTDPDGQACNPAGYNANTTGYPTCEAGAASAQSSATPPRCSRTVKDHCVQAYERGVRR